MKRHVTRWTKLARALGLTNRQPSWKHRVRRNTSFERLEPREMLAVDVSIGDGAGSYSSWVDVNEGDVSVSFEVKLSEAPLGDVTVSYRLVDNTATGGESSQDPGADYFNDTDFQGGQPLTDTLVIPSGTTEGFITAAIVDDSVAELGESFDVEVYAASSNDAGDTVSIDQQHDSIFGFILDDDTPPGAPTVSISDAQPVAEGQSATFTVSLSEACSDTVLVAYSTGTNPSDANPAVPDIDYTSQLFPTLTFQPYETSKTISVATIDDSEQEGAETFHVILNDSANATINAQNCDAVGTIQASDELPTVSLAGNVTVTEGDNVNAVFTVNLSHTYASDVTVYFDTANPASGAIANAGADYTAQPANSSVTIPAGFTSTQISVPILNDTDTELDESFDLELTGADNATLSGNTLAIATIQDDDKPDVSITPTVSVTEGDGSATFTVTLSHSSTLNVLVPYATYAGSAGSSDYTSISNTLTFLPTETSKTITVSIADNNLPEQDETFTVGLGSPTNANLGGGSQLSTATIHDNGDLPEFSVEPTASVNEDASTANFTVSLNVPSYQDVSVHYATATGSAGVSDFTSTSGTLTIPAGQTSGVIAVPITNDDLPELDEDFTVTLDSPTNATLNSSQYISTATIHDDGDVPVISISASEGQIQEAAAASTLTVALSVAGVQDVTVDLQKVAGTASGADYTLSTTSLVFTPGETTKTVQLQSVDDAIDEPDEDVSIGFANLTNATVDGQNAQAAVMILDNDPPPTLSINNVTVAENVAAGVAVFTVTLTGQTAFQVSVDYATVDGSANPLEPAAVAGADYAARAGTLVFTPGQVTKQISVPIINDNIDEFDEYFRVLLGNPQFATITTATGLGIILDDGDAPSVVSILQVTPGREGNPTTPANVWISLDKPSGKPISVLLSTADSSAKSGGEAPDDDYVPQIGTVVPFAAGVILQNVQIAINDDTEPELNENFLVTLNQPINAFLGAPAQAFVPIIDNDNQSSAEIIRSDDGDCGCSSYNVSANADLMTGDQESWFSVLTDLSFNFAGKYFAHPIFAGDVVFPASAPTPDSIVANLTFNGVAQTPVHYDPSSLEAGQLLRFAVQADASGLPTGSYDWELDVTFTSGQEYSTATFSGRRDIVNRDDSSFGNGWGVEGVDSLLFDGPDVILITEKARTARYRSDGAGGFITPAGRFDTLYSSGGGYTLVSGAMDVSTFDSSGKITQRSDRNGNTTTYAYDAQDRLTSITDPLGDVTTFAYQNGFLASATDDAGRVSLFSHDASGLLTSVEYPDPNSPDAAIAPILYFDYDSASGKLTSLTDGDGNVTSFGYDEFGRLQYSDHADSSRTTLQAYSLPGAISESAALASASSPVPLFLDDERVGSLTDELGNTSTYTTDRFGNITLWTDPLGNTTTWTRDSDGLVTTLTEPDPDGAGSRQAQVTQYEYDSDNITQITYADSSTETWTYGPFDQPTSHTDTLGQQTLWGIDSNTGDILSMTQVVGQVDDAGNGETDDVTTTYTYTATPQNAGDLPGGLPLTETDPLGRVMQYAYETDSQSEDFGLLRSVTLASDTADEVTSSFEYDAAGNLTAVIDPLSRRTEYVYDDLNRLIAVTQPDPDGAGPQVAPETTYQYDSNNNLVSQIAPDTGFTSYEYDARNRLTALTLPDPAIIGGYNGPRYEYTYDLAGNLTSETAPTSASYALLGAVTDYAYDDAGRLISTTLPEDANGQRPEFTYTYDDANYLLSQTDPRGAVTSYDYDVRGRLVSITLPDPDDTGPLDAPTQSFTYDSAGQLLSQTDPLGATTSYGYDDLGRLNMIMRPDPAGAVPPNGPVDSFDYDKAGNLLHSYDPLGQITTYQYDNLNRLTTILEADPDGAGPQSGPIHTFSYDDAGQMTGQTDPLGRDTAYAYDDLGRLITLTQPDPSTGAATGPQTSYTYDILGNVLSQTDPLGNVTAYEYDGLSRLTHVTLPDPDGAGSAVSPEYFYTYDDVGNLLTQTDPLTRETSYAYDALNRLTTLTLPDPSTGAVDGPATTYDYDLAGNLTSQLDALGNSTAYAYDLLGRLTTLTQPDPSTGQASGPETGYGYDAAGNLTSQTDALGNTTAYAYDLLGRLTTLTEPDPDGAGSATSPQTTYAYDLAGNLTSQTDPLGNTTDYQYDNLYRQTAVLQPDPDGAGSLGRPTTSFTYDAIGNVTSLTDPVNNTTTWTYDGLDRVIQETNSLNDSRYYTYDDAGNLTEKTDRDGRVTDYTYDNLYRTTSEVWKDSGGTTVNTIDYTYDAANQLLTAGDSYSDYTYSYDMLGRVTSVDNSGTPDVPDVVLTSTYDDLGRRTQLAATVNGAVDFVNDYQFDALSRMTQVEQHGETGGAAVAEKRVDFTYNDLGQFDTISRYADLAGTQLVATSTYTYDDLSRLTGLTHAKDTTTLADYAWTYDAASRVTAFTNSVHTSEDATYSYDTTNQLTAADRAGTTDDELFSYDENGNRTISGYTIGTNNQILSDGTYNYDYDAEGNRTRKTNIATGDYTVYEWDNRNRLTRVASYDSSDTLTADVHYSYDVFDRRIAKTIDTDGAGSGVATESHYVYDELQIPLAFDADGSLTNRYLHGPAVDQVLADEQFTPTAPGEQPTSPGDVLWPLADNQGTVRDIADSTGAILNHINYSATGHVTSETAPTVEEFFGYHGGQQDPETGNLYRWHRYADLALSTWLSQDPLSFAAGDTNLQRYVGNAPSDFVDASGLVIKMERLSSQELSSQLHEVSLHLVPSRRDRLHALTGGYIYSEKEMQAYVKSRQEFAPRKIVVNGREAWTQKIDKDRMAKGMCPPADPFSAAFVIWGTVSNRLREMGHGGFVQEVDRQVFGPGADPKWYDENGKYFGPAGGMPPFFSPRSLSSGRLPAKQLRIPNRSPLKNRMGDTSKAARRARTDPVYGRSRPAARLAPARIGRTEIISRLRSALADHLAAIRKVDPNARIGIRGSLAKGVKGPQKGNAPFDPTNFDIDIFIVSDKLRRGRGFQVGPKPIRDLAKQIDAELRNLPEFAGLRGGKDKLQFRIFGSDEIGRLSKKGDVQVFFGE